MTRTARKPTIGTNPLDAVIPPAMEPQPERPAKVRRASIHIALPLLDGVRDAVVALSMRDPAFYGLSVTAFAEEAVRRELDRMQRERNKGKPFPKRPAPVRRGRPILS